MKYKNDREQVVAAKRDTYLGRLVRSYGERWADRMERSVRKPSDVNRELVLSTLNDPELVLAGAGLFLAYGFLVDNWEYGEVFRQFYVDLFPDMHMSRAQRFGIPQMLKDKRNPVTGKGDSSESDR